MLISMYFDELDQIRKKIQRDIMGKVDCVTEACNESFDRGKEQGIERGIDETKRNAAIKMLKMKKYSIQEISELVELSLGEIEDLKNTL